MLPFYQEPLCRTEPYKIFSNQAFSFDAHWHSEIEVIYVINGSVSVTVANTDYELTTDCFIIIDSGIVHSVNAGNRSSSILIIETGYELLGESFSNFSESEIQKRKWDKSCEEDRGSVFFQYFGDILNIILSGNPKSAENDFKLRAILNLFACELLKHSRTPVNAKKQRQRTDFLAMQKVLSIIENRYAEALTVDEIAGQTGYEKTRFCQLFKRAIGVTFHQYLNQVRIEKARQLIRSSDYSMAEIGERVGLKEPKTFSRVFRAFCHCTPTEYKDKNFNKGAS